MTNDLDNLEAKLAQIRAVETAEKNETAQNLKDAENMSQGLKAGSELIAALIGGVVIGLLLDKWLGTLPVFLIIFTLAGIGTGFYNVYKITQNAGSGVGIAPLHNKEKQGTKAPEKHKEDE